MKAIYHQDASTRITLDVLENKAGRVTLGREKEVLVVGVPVSKDGAPGTCTLVEDEDPKKTAKAAAAALRKKATEAAKAAVNARKAADAAKGKPNEADLVKAAEEADAAAQQADTEADAAEAALKE